MSQQREEEVVAFLPPGVDTGGMTNAQRSIAHLLTHGYKLQHDNGNQVVLTKTYRTGPKTIVISRQDDK